MLKEFLHPMGISQKAVASHIGIPVQRIYEIVRGKRGVSPDTGWLLYKVFKTLPEFWLNLQATHELSIHKPKRGIQPLVAISAQVTKMSDPRELWILRKSIESNASKALDLSHLFFN